MGKSPASWQHWFLRVHRNFSTERKLSKLKAFSSVLELQRNFFWKIVKNLSATFYVSVGKILMKNIEDNFFLLFFGPPAKHLWSSVKKFPTGFSELHSMCPWEQFDGKRSFLKKSKTFKAIQYIQRETSAPITKKNGAFIRTRFYVSVGTIRQNFFFKKVSWFFNFFSDLERKV